MIAEADEDVYRLLTLLLQGFAEVLVEPDGMSALSKIRSMKRSPDLIIADIMMPRILPALR